MASFAKRPAKEPDAEGRCLTDWERKAARSIVRKEERRREESALEAPAKLILPSDVCRGFLAGTCTSQGSCGLNHRIPPEFWTFAAKAKKQDSNATGGGQQPAPAAPTAVGPPAAASEGGSDPQPAGSSTNDVAAIVVIDNELFDVSTLQQELDDTASVVPAKNVTGRGFAVALGIASKRSLSSAVTAIVAAASHEDPKTSVISGLGCAVSARRAVTVRGIAIVLNGPLDSIVFAALSLPAPVKESVTALIGGGPAGWFDPVGLVLQRLVTAACGTPCTCVPVESPRLFAKTAASAKAGFVSLWCETALVPDKRDSELARGARAAASALRSL